MSPAQHVSRYRAQVMAILFLVLAGSLSHTNAQQPPTVRQGVYTQEQAARGAAIYRERCVTCHGDSLGGRIGPPLTGDDFIVNWQSQPLSELAIKIQSTMPQGSPAKLTATQTADVVAYILQAGKFPAGRAELSADEGAQRQIAWPASMVATKASTATGAVSFPPAGNLAQLMRGVLFPSSNLIFTVQTVDPGAVKPQTSTTDATAGGGFNTAIWGGGVYSAWDTIDYAAVALAESAPLLLTPGRRCENGKPVPVNDPEWIKFTQELANAARASYRASQTRNQEKVSDSTNDLNDACLNCHLAYRDKRLPNTEAIDPVNKSLRCVK